MLMGFNSGTTVVNSVTNNVIDKYLQFSKGKFVHYNKDLGKNEIEDLSKVAILDIGYTIKGGVWNNDSQKYTHQYYSNEVKSLHHTMYFLRHSYADSSKELLATGKYSEIKELVKSTEGASLNLCVTVFDFNTSEIKEFFISGTNMVDFNSKVQEYQKANIISSEIFSIDVTTRYTKNTKDEKGNQIFYSESDLDKMSKAEMIGMQPRYSINLMPTGVKYDENTKEMLIDIENKLDAYYVEKNNAYAKQYPTGVVVTESHTTENNGYYVPKLDETIDNVQIATPSAPAFKMPPKQDDEISIEDIPF